MADVVQQHDAFIQVIVDGDEILGYWEQHSRPNASWSTGRYRPGGSKHAVATRGLPDRGEGTVTKAITFDQLGTVRQLERAGDRGAKVKVIEQPRDAAGDPFGDATTFTGVLGGVQVSDFDNDGDDNRTVQLTYQADDQIG